MAVPFRNNRGNTAFLLGNNKSRPGYVEDKNFGGQTVRSNETEDEVRNMLTKLAECKFPKSDFEHDV